MIMYIIKVSNSFSRDCGFSENFCILFIYWGLSKFLVVEKNAFFRKFCVEKLFLFPKLSTSGNFGFFGKLIVGFVENFR